MRLSLSLIVANKISLLWLAFSLALLVNCGPIFFPDTTAYFRVADAAANFVGFGQSDWSDRLKTMEQSKNITRNARQIKEQRETTATTPTTPLAGRSIYYGAILLFFGTQFTAVLQSFVGAVAVFLSMRRIAPKIPFIALPITVGLSSASIFAALLMPDFFAALAVIAASLILTSWRTMQRPERFFWFCLLMIGVLSHTATLLIVIGMLVVAMLVWRRKISAQPVGLAIALGVLGEFAFALGVSYAIGSPPLRPPFLSARLIADGPGRTFLEKSCYPERRFVQCDFFRTFPSNSDAILWEGNGVGFISKSKAVQRKWSREDTSFAVAVVLNDPVSVARTSFFSILRQASGVRIDDVVTPLETIDRIPKSERARYNSTLVSRGLFPTENWNTAGLVLLTFAVGGLLVFWRQVSITGTIMLIGLIFDVVLCGALSTPHDRYLMRLVWILPLVALSVMPWELWATRQRSLMRFVWAQRYRRRTGHDDMMQVEVIRNLNGDRDLT